MRRCREGLSWQAPVRMTIVSRVYPVGSPETVPIAVATPVVVSMV